MSEGENHGMFKAFLKARMKNDVEDMKLQRYLHDLENRKYYRLVALSSAIYDQKKAAFDARRDVVDVVMKSGKIPRDKITIPIVEKPRRKVRLPPGALVSRHRTSVSDWLVNLRAKHAMQQSRRNQYVPVDAAMKCDDNIRKEGDEQGPMKSPNLCKSALPEIRPRETSTLLLNPPEGQDTSLHPTSPDVMDTDRTPSWKQDSQLRYISTPIITVASPAGELGDLTNGMDRPVSDTNVIMESDRSSLPILDGQLTAKFTNGSQVQIAHQNDRKPLCDVTSTEQISIRIVAEDATRTSPDHSNDGRPRGKVGHAQTESGLTQRHEAMQDTKHSIILPLIHRGPLKQEDQNKGKGEDNADDTESPKQKGLPGYWPGDPLAISSVRRPRRDVGEMIAKSRTRSHVRQMTRQGASKPGCSRGCHIHNNDADETGDQFTTAKLIQEAKRQSKKQGSEVTEHQQALTLRSVLQKWEESRQVAANQSKSVTMSWAGTKIDNKNTHRKKPGSLSSIPFILTGHPKKLYALNQRL